MLLTVGGVFAVSVDSVDQCIVKMIVILEGEADLVARERVYYEAAHSSNADEWPSRTEG